MRFRSLVLFAIALAAAAQTSRSVTDGVFTQEQADRGKSAYASQCASCHGVQLTGGDEAPALTGERFLAKWRTRSVDDLFENIRATMPADRPGTLSRAMNSDIIAWILASNRFKAGTGELSTEASTLKQ